MTDPALLDRLDRLTTAITAQAAAIERLVEALAEEELEGDDAQQVLAVPRYMDGTPIA